MCVCFLLLVVFFFDLLEVLDLHLRRVYVVDLLVDLLCRTYLYYNLMLRRRIYLEFTFFGERFVCALARFRVAL